MAKKTFELKLLVTSNKKKKKQNTEKAFLAPIASRDYIIEDKLNFLKSNPILKFFPDWLHSCYQILPNFLPLRSRLTSIGDRPTRLVLQIQNFQRQFFNIHSNVSHT